MSDLYRLTALFIMIPVVAYLAKWGLSLANLHLQTETSHSFSSAAIQRAMNLPGKVLESRDLTKTIHEINNDACQIVIFLLNIVSNLIPQCLIFVVVLMILAEISVWMVFLVLFLNGLYIFVLITQKKRLVDLREEYLNSQSAYFSSLYQWMSGWSLCRRYPTKLAETDALDSNRKLIRKAARQLNASQLFSGLRLLVQLLPQILLLLIGGTRVWQGTLSLGWFVACLSYLNQFQSAVSNLTGWADQLQAVGACCRRISFYFSVNSKGSIIAEKISLADIYRIQLDQLCISFGENHVIENANYQFVSGEVTVLTGENGCGKSTLLKAIGGLMEEESNSVSFFDGKGKKVEGNRARICGSLLQNDFYLDRHSPKDNLLRSDPDPEMFSYLIQGFGLEKVLSYVHQKWSGGEYEKLFLVRTFLSDRSVLLFDEPTNNLDESSRHFFIQAIQKFKQHKIIVCVSHDPLVLGAADTILSMDSSESKKQEYQLIRMEVKQNKLKTE